MFKPAIQRIALLLGAAVLTACQTAPPVVESDLKLGKGWQLIPHSRKTADDPDTLRAYFQPVANAAAPTPAIVLLHGCGGVGNGGVPSTRHKAAIEQWSKEGYAVLFLDSFATRGEKELCTQRYSSRKVQPADRARDAKAAHDFLAKQPQVDAKKIMLLGWSHGGSTVLQTQDGDSPFAAAVAFYPGCGNFARNVSAYRLASPLFILIGEADDWTPAAPCGDFAQALQARQAPIEIIRYPGAYHGFDGMGKLTVRKDVPNGVKPGQGVTSGHDPAGYADSRIKVPAFFKKYW
jgi:dienelactone hydrolase